MTIWRVIPFYDHLGSVFVIPLRRREKTDDHAAPAGLCGQTTNLVYNLADTTLGVELDRARAIDIAGVAAVRHDHLVDSCLHLPPPAIERCGGSASIARLRGRRASLFFQLRPAFGTSRRMLGFFRPPKQGSSFNVRNVLIVLNERAGSLLDRDPLAVKAELRRRLAEPGHTVDVLLAHGRSIGRAVNRGAASDYDTIIVGGGDGSVGHAAHRLAGTDKALGVLPLGTVNLLARDIGVPAYLDDAIAAVEEFVPRAIDLGMLNGRAFHTLSGMGFFSQMARAREDLLWPGNCPGQG